MIVQQKTALTYVTPTGKVPFEDWLGGLKDRGSRALIRARVRRLELGNAGSCKPVGKGVYELKIHYGPGFRVYFGIDGPTLVILLCGGDKSTQSADIKKAKTYWDDYGRRK